VQRGPDREDLKAASPFRRHLGRILNDSQLVVNERSQVSLNESPGLLDLSGDSEQLATIGSLSVARIERTIPHVAQDSEMTAYAEAWWKTAQAMRTRYSVLPSNPGVPASQKVYSPPAGLTRSLCLNNSRITKGRLSLLRQARDYGVAYFYVIYT